MNIKRKLDQIENKLKKLEEKAKTKEFTLLVRGTPVPEGFDKSRVVFLDEQDFLL